MIVLKVYRDRQGMIEGYEVSGHAGQEEAGRDIICSAVSALTQAPVLGLEKHLKMKPFCEVDQERGILRVALNDAPDDLTQAVFVTMLCGMESISRQCPQYVRVEEHRR